VYVSTSPEPGALPAALHEAALPALRELEQTREQFDFLFEKLVAEQRYVLLGKLAGMVTHEFKNLLTPLISRNDFALQQGTLADLRRAAEVTLQQTQKAIAFGQKLLALVDAAPADEKCCQLATAIRELSETFARPFNSGGVQLRVALPAELVLRGDPVLFSQVILNLLLNARAAMAERGGVIHVSARREAEDAIIDVADTGPGISPERMEREFNAFLANDPRRVASDCRHIGTGLGVCRVIAHRHGASLRVVANDGPGCTFRLRWPLAAQGSA